MITVDILVYTLLGITLLFFLWILYQTVVQISVNNPMTVEEFLSKPCPEGVKSPIYELCQKMVEDVDFLRMTTESWHTMPYNISEYIDTFGVVYTVRWMDCLHNPLGYYTITHIRLPDKSSTEIVLSHEEDVYFNLALGLRGELLSGQQNQKRATQEQLVRDAVTKLYSQPSSEVTQNDQTN